METKDWILLLVPIIFTILFSLSTTIINNKLQKRKNKKKLVIDRMRILVDYVTKMDNLSIYAQCQVLEFEKWIHDFFMTVGDLQAYLKHNETALKLENSYQGKDYLQLDLLNVLIETTTQMGINLQSNSELNVAIFGKKFKECQDI